MKTTLLTLTLAGLLVGANGCVVSIGSRNGSPPPAPVLTPPDAATVAEIDAAARLDFDSSRSTALTAIAKRPDLSPTAQVHLVNVAYRRLDFAESKVAVLRAVIANPAFCDAARQSIVSQLGQLPFDANKQAVLEELNKRMTPAKDG